MKPSSSEANPPAEPTFFVQAGPRRAAVGPVPARAIWRALRLGTIDFHSLARPSRDVAWRPLAYWLGEAEVNAAAAAEFDDAAPTLVRQSPRGSFPSAPVVELGRASDEPDGEDRRSEPRSPSLAPATSPTFPPPARTRRTWHLAAITAAGLLLVAATVAMTTTPSQRASVASMSRAIASLDRGDDRHRATTATGAPSSMEHEPVERDDELSRALRRAEMPPPPVVVVKDPCDGLADGGRAICEWAGLVSVGVDAKRPPFGTIQAFLRASRVRHASGVVLERISASREWPTHRVTVDWDHGYCLAAPDDRFGPGKEWGAWVVVQTKPLAAERCIPAETADFVGPLLDLHQLPVGPEAAAYALRVRRELAAFAERHPASGTASQVNGPAASGRGRLVRASRHATSTTERPEPRPGEVR